MGYYSRNYPVGYTYHADIYCSTCGESLPDIDPEGNEKYPVMSWDTGDMYYEQDGKQYPYTCGECGEPVTEW